MNVIFAIYYKGICQYIGYTNNLTKRINQFKNKMFYKNKISRRDASESFIHFLEFYQNNFYSCKVLVLEKELELSECVILKNEYIRTFKPIYNKLDS